MTGEMNTVGTAKMDTTKMDTTRIVEMNCGSVRKSLWDYFAGTLEDSERDGFIHRLRLNMNGVRNAIRVDERDAVAFDSHAQDCTQYSPFVRSISIKPRLGLYRNLCG